MTPTLDDLRAKYPHLSLTVYAYSGQPVVLECITGDGTTFKFTAPTEADAIKKGFPEDFAEPAPAAPPAPSNVFD
jgi:hypothetical protein